MIMPLYTLLILKNIVSHGNSNHLITLGLFGDGEGSLVRFRSGALLRGLRADG